MRRWRQCGSADLLVRAGLRGVRLHGVRTMDGRRVYSGVSTAMMTRVRVGLGCAAR
jgi:hypothetical protein